MPEAAAAPPSPATPPVVVPPVSTEKPPTAKPIASASPPPAGLVSPEAETVTPAELEHRRRLVRLAQGEERSRKDREAVDKDRAKLEADQKTTAEMKLEAEALRAVKAALTSGKPIDALRNLGLSDDQIADLYEKDLTDHYLSSRKDLTADEIADLAATKATEKIAADAATAKKKADEDAVAAGQKAREEILTVYVTEGDTAWDDTASKDKWPRLRKLADMGLVDRKNHVDAYLARAHRLYQETKKVPSAAEILDKMDEAAGELPLFRGPVDAEGRKPSTTATADWNASQAPTGEVLPKTFEERVAYRLKQAGVT